MIAARVAYARAFDCNQCNYMDRTSSRGGVLALYAAPSLEVYIIIVSGMSRINELCTHLIEDQTRRARA